MKRIRKTKQEAQSQITTRFKAKASTCTICLGTIEEQGVLDSCCHEFCYECIITWSKRENSCPNCKKRFNNIDSKWLRFNYDEKKKSVKKESKKIKVPIRNQLSSNSETLLSGMGFQSLLSNLNHIWQDIRNIESISLEIHFIPDASLFGSRPFPFPFRLTSVGLIGSGSSERSMRILSNTASQTEGQENTNFILNQPLNNQPNQTLAQQEVAFVMQQPNNEETTHN